MWYVCEDYNSFSQSQWPHSAYTSMQQCLPCSNVFHVLTMPRNSTISDFWSSITTYQQLLVGLAKWLLIVLTSRWYCISLFIK